MDRHTKGALVSRARIDSAQGGRGRWPILGYLVALAVISAGSLMTLGLSAIAALPAPAPVGYGAGPSYCQQQGNQNSSYSFEDVYACATTSTTGDTPFDSNGTQSLQCVDLSARFLWAVYGIAAPRTDGWNLVAQTNITYPSIRVGHPGPGSVPMAGDVISFGDSAPGHTAVVISSNPATGDFRVMSQNAPFGMASVRDVSIDLTGGHPGQANFPLLGGWTTASWLELPFISISGNTYVVAGAAPLYIASCQGLPVQCNQPRTLESGTSPQRSLPWDGTYIATPPHGGVPGDIYVVVGGAPLYLNDCTGIPACSYTVPISQYTIDNLGAPPSGVPHLLPTANDNSYINTPNRNGDVYAIAGGAPLYVNDCTGIASRRCNSPVGVSPFTIDNLGAIPNGTPRLRQTAANGAYINTPNRNGYLYAIAGGAPLYLDDCTGVAACSSGSVVSVSPYTIDNLGAVSGGTPRLRQTAADDGSYIYTPNTNGYVYALAGGAPLYVNDCSGIVSPGCNKPIGVSQYTIDHLGADPTGGVARLSRSPADGAFINVPANAGQKYETAGSAALPIPTCSGLAATCLAPISVALGTISNLGAAPNRSAPMTAVPVDGTVLQGVPSGTYWQMMSGCRFDAGSTPSAVVTRDEAVATIPICATPRVVLPAVSNGAYGGYVTAATIQNTGSQPETVEIAYYDQNGAPVGTGDVINSLPVNGSWTVRQDDSNSFPSSGGDAAQAGSAVVSSSGPVAAFVNEFAPGNVGDATSYTGVQVANGVGTTLYAPTIVNHAYGGYTTGIGLLNEGSSPTDVTITYRDRSGAVVKSQTVPGLAAHAYHALYSGDATLALPGGFAGTATITSSAAQPLGAIVNETGPGGQFSSYDAVPVGSTTLYAPAALSNAFGGYNTGMGIQNTSGTAGAVTVTYYDNTGTPTAHNFVIGANGYVGIYQGTDIAAGAYTAKITSTVAVAATVNEVAPSGNAAVQQSTAYNTFAAGSSSLHLPLVDSAGSDGWSTGEGIMNTGMAATTVTMTYYDAASGLQVGTPDTLLLQPNAFWGLYQPAGGLPSGDRASATVTTTAGGQVAVICNESNATSFMSYTAQ
jgi:hypothetical protein